jgi:hypothetical protein
LRKVRQKTNGNDRASVKKTAFSILSLYLALYVLPSHSATLEQLNPESKLCKTFVGRTQYLSEIIKAYEVESLGKIESIPSESSDYLAKEYKAAIDSHSEARFNLLQSNKYYQAWRLASSVNELKDKANQSYWFYNNKKKSEVMKYVAVIEAQHAVREQFSEYERFDSMRTPSVLQKTTFIDCICSSY